MVALCATIIAHSATMIYILLFEYVKQQTTNDTMRNDGKQLSIFFCYCFIRDNKKIEKTKTL